MRRTRAKARPMGVGTVVFRLAAVVAALLAVRAVSDRVEDRGTALRLPEPLGEAALGAELAGFEVELTDAGAVLLGAELPGGLVVPPAPAEAAPADKTGDGEAEAPGVEGGEAGDLGLPVADEGENGVSEGENGSSEGKNGAPEGEAGGPDGGEGTDSPAESGGDGGGAGGGEPEVAAIGTTITGAGGGYTSSGEGIYLKNRMDYDIDVEDYLERPLGFSKGAAVLIIHTHGSEAYNPAGEDIYVPSDPSRTEDKSYNVVRVGDELERVLRERGVTVYHNRELYDYPSYAGSYERTLTAIKAELSDHPDIGVVIDLHRDALEGDGKVYKTVADVGDEPSAQVMLICGTNFSGLRHPEWEKNLSFAVKIQKRMVDKYPTLARPLKISEYRYNQHATTGSLIAEVGTNGNTLQEALTAVRYFGDCLADVLAGE